MKNLLKVCLLGLLAMSSLVQAQQWPNRPITLIVSYPPGGTADLMAKIGRAHV